MAIIESLPQYTEIVIIIGVVGCILWWIGYKLGNSGFMQVLFVVFVILMAAYRDRISNIFN